MVSSYLVSIGFRSEGDSCFSGGDSGSFSASLLACGSLSTSGLLEGCSSELLVLHDLRSYVISRGNRDRESLNTRKKVDYSSKGNFKRRYLR